MALDRQAEVWYTRVHLSRVLDRLRSLAHTDGGTCRYNYVVFTGAFSLLSEDLMPITNTFTCPKGHTFDAVAKIRARCPECGAMVRRNFSTEAPKPNPDGQEPKHEPAIKPVQHKGTVVIRQGRPMPARKVTKPAHTSKAKVTPKPKTHVTTPTRAVVAEKPRVVSSGVVQMRKAKAGVTPTIKRTPRKSSVSRVAHEIGGRNKSYMQRVIDRYGF